MDATTRRKLEMGRRALAFSRAHPDASAGYATAVGQLEERLARADRLATQQRDGILEERAATARKRELRELVTEGHLDHLATVAREAAAAGELRGSVTKFVLAQAPRTYQAFRTAARAMAAEAAAHREVLVRYGLVESMLGELGALLDQFDVAIAQGDDARRKHIVATHSLTEVAHAVVSAVEVMHGVNRVRFADDPATLAAWESASSVVTVSPSAPAAEQPPSAGPDTGPGEVQPAA